MHSRGPLFTRAQRDMLTLALRSETGNPWLLIGMKGRTGGAKSRMFDEMKAKSLFDASNCITEAGRCAQANGRWPA